QNDVTLKMPAFEWVHVQLHQQKGMISLSPPTICNSALDTLGMDELIAKAWRFVRERFCSYQTELKSRGIKRARARRDANRERQDIVTLVKRQLTREISEGRFSASREAVKREVERRVKERMILSRNRNYSRLATASP
ncbi:hypothetical protein QSI50_24540, partial [Escherichia coli]|nr:hypothetical protein [Escherichia coli]MDS2042671.1 hypothetical protein [Escherichia coli]MDS2092231.1 hypothetical protein [Escherichia coli]MDS2096936.1 hypothetical protein [Escherichia coli]MDS2131579.1 hypothetical protein [Escherichia coli]